MTRAVRVLELRSVRGTGGGPEKTILLGSARTDPQRFAITVCYLRDRRDPIFNVDRQASALPLDYIEIVEAHSFDWSVFRRLRRVVRERGIDIIHAHDYKANLLAWLVARVEPVVPMSTAHGWTGHSGRERFLYYPLDKLLLSRFPRVIGVSSDVRRELTRHGAAPERVVTVLNGIDHTAFGRDHSRQRQVRQALGLADGDLAIGAVGRLEPQKRFDLLLEAFAELRAANRRVVLFVVGDGSAKDALAADVARLGLGNVCRLLGHRTDVVSLHHAFDLFVQSSDYEGTPNAVLEAMALETPIVATAAGGTAEILRDQIDGLVVPIGDRASLVRAMRAALDDRAAAASRATSARRRVETDLSFDTRMQSVESIYLELMENRDRPTAAPALTART
ncbi:MAG: epsD 3 [Acidobacteria bacterium]|nr:epsD 3 [Acidobacteriota bacterium]